MRPRTFTTVTLVAASLATVAACGAKAPPAAPMTGARPRLPPSVEPTIDVDVTPYGLCVRARGTLRCAYDLPSDELAAAGPFEAEDVLHLSAAGAKCIVTTKHELRCRGSNEWGELGAGLASPASDAWVSPIGIASVRYVAADDSRVCAIASDGRVYCWGRNDSGETTGDVRYDPDARELVRPVPVLGVGEAVKLVIGHGLTCALSTDRRVRCWGSITVPGAPGNVGAYAPFVIEHLTDVDDLASAHNAICALRRGEVSCWGEFGGLFPGPAYDATFTPIRIEGLPNARRLAMSSRRACIIDEAARVGCWGESDVTRAEGRITATPGIVSLPPVLGVAVGDFATCAILERDELRCWGRWPRRFDEADPTGAKAPVAHEPTRVPFR